MNNNVNNEIINDFINREMVKVKNDSDVINFFHVFSNFLDKRKIAFNNDTILLLLKKNMIFYNAIKMVFDKYSTPIKSGYLEQLFLNKRLVSSLEMYCAINNIEISMVDFGDESFDESEKIYLSEIRKYPLLTSDEEKSLIIKAQSGDMEAKDLFVKSNLRLVVSVARRRLNRGLPLLDLVQEGNFGLIRALEKYDVNLGYRFSTYAFSWIRQFMDRAIEFHGKSIRIPSYMMEKIKRVLRTENMLTTKLNREPTIKEISEASGFSEDQVLKYLSYQIDVCSLDLPVGEDNPSPMYELIEDEKSSFDEKIAQNSLQSIMQEFLLNTNINIREYEVIKLCFGFYNNYEYTLESIGEIYGVSRECVRQVRERAKTRMLEDEEIKNLIVYMRYPEMAEKKLREHGYMRRRKRNYTFSKEKHDVVQITQSIYDYFPDYSKKMINEAIMMLKESDHALLNLCYGERIGKPVFGIISKKAATRFFSHLIPTVQENLDIINNKSQIVLQKSINY